MNKAKQFILDNDPQIEEAVDQGYGIVMTEDELLEWMQRYADNEVKNLTLPQVSGSASDFEKQLYKLITDYVKAGLKKSDLVSKLEYVTQSCRVS